MSKSALELLSILNEELATLDLRNGKPLTSEDAEAMRYDDLIVNSLDSLQVAMRLEEASGREISISELRKFDHIMQALIYLSDNAE